MKKVLKRGSYPRLSVYEQNVLLPILMKGLEMKKSKENAVTAKQIVKGVKSQGLKINITSVDKIINHIRMNDLIVGLMGSCRGYYVAKCEQEFINYEANLQVREAALRKVRMSMQRQRRSMYAHIPAFTNRQTQLF
ncbi:MAG: hypothetical protein GX762_02195 [Bacteroidales bacterium]|nr:hypothetical protein [Bacteroidales bacterium]